MSSHGLDPDDDPFRGLRKFIDLARRDHWLLVFAVASYVFIAALNITALFMLNSATTGIKANGVAVRELVQQNRRTLAVQVPTLEKRIAELEQTVADQKYVLDQAIAWILKLTDQIDALGGEPPKIVLQPPQHEQEAP